MHQETVSGLHKCQPKNAPEAGTIKNMVVLNMPAKNGKKAWISIKNKKPEEGGSPYRILNVEPLDWPPDQYGNIAMNLEVEASSSPPSTVQNLRATMQQSEAPMPRSDDEQDWPEAPEKAPQSPPHAQQGEDGVTATRKHLMQSANLLVLCIRAVENAVAPHQPVVAQTSEQFQSDVAKLFIEASSRRTTDGVNWWSFIDRMPTTPLVPNGKHSATGKPIQKTTAEDMEVPF